MSEQPALDLGQLTPRQVQHRGEGEHGRAERTEPDPDKVVWRRVHTTEHCQVCVAEQMDRFLKGEHGHASWPASYIRTEKGERRALCFTHAAPLRAAEGLGPQRRSRR